nr:hypothetical protein [Streptomyces sp. NBRC 109706]
MVDEVVFEDRFAVGQHLPQHPLHGFRAGQAQFLPGPPHGGAQVEGAHAGRRRVEADHP